eukprot:gene1958-3804_t
MMFDTIFGKPHRAYEESFDGHNMVRLIKCNNVDETTTTILFAMEGLMLAYGAHLCWSTKEVPGAVNDSSYISLALFLILFVCALTFPIVFLNITPTPTILMTIMAAGFFIAVCGCIIIMFAPKTNLIFSGAQVDENLKIVYDNKRPAGSSSTSHVINQLKDKIRNRTSNDKYGSTMRSNAQAQSIDKKTSDGNADLYASPQKKTKTNKWISPLNKGKVDNNDGNGSHRSSYDNNNRVTDYSVNKCENNDHDDESCNNSTPEVGLSVKSNVSSCDFKATSLSTNGRVFIYQQGGYVGGGSAIEEEKSGKINMVSVSESDGDM